MKILLFGATGMVGQGVLRECLLDPEVGRVVCVGRTKTGQEHEKVQELITESFTDFSAIEEQLAGFDACFFCLGVSAAGMSEQDYTRITYDFTLAAARALVKKSPDMTFIYVSGTGTDSTEKGRSMWARVKGKTENDLMRLPFRKSFMFRPGYIQPLHGIVSKTKLYRVIYAVMGPMFPLWKAVFPKYMITTEQVGKAMLAVAKRGASKQILENRDLAEIASPAS